MTNQANRSSCAIAMILGRHIRCEISWNTISLLKHLVLLHYWMKLYVIRNELLKISPSCHFRELSASKLHCTSLFHSQRVKLTRRHYISQGGNSLWDRSLPHDSSIKTSHFPHIWTRGINHFWIVPSALSYPWELIIGRWPPPVRKLKAARWSAAFQMAA